LDGSRTVAVHLLNIILDIYPFPVNGFEPLASQFKYSKTTYQCYNDSCMKDKLVLERESVYEFNDKEIYYGKVNTSIKIT